MEAGRPRERESVLRCEYLRCKKAFNKRLHALATEYENDTLRETMSSAEINKNQFWRIVKRNRGSNNSKIFAVQNKEGKIVHDLDDVLEVWRLHFSGLFTPTPNPDFDATHSDHVNGCVDV